MCIRDRAMRLMEQHPAVPLCHESYNYKEAVVDRLTAKMCIRDSVNTL